MHNHLPSADWIEPAAFALIARRCRAALLHDLRGDLQALSGAIELLARAARNGNPAPAAADKASELARRSLAKHECELVQALETMAPPDEAASSADAGEIVERAVRLLRSQATRRSVELRAAGTPSGLKLRARAGACRALVIGVTAEVLDRLPRGATLALKVTADGDAVAVEWHADAPRGEMSETLGASAPHAVFPTPSHASLGAAIGLAHGGDWAALTGEEAYALILEATARFATAAGGTLARTGGDANVLRLRLPAG